LTHVIMIDKVAVEILGASCCSFNLRINKHREARSSHKHIILLTIFRNFRTYQRSSPFEYRLSSNSTKQLNTELPTQVARLNSCRYEKGWRRSGRKSKKFVEIREINLQNFSNKSSFERSIL